MATLSFRKVKKTYAGNVPVIHGIDMDVKDGEFIVIVGPSAGRLRKRTTKHAKGWRVRLRP